MSEQNYFKFSNSVVIAPLGAVLLIWIVYWMELRFQTNFNDFGLYPRRISGLQGLLFSPFIHGSLEHLYNNTIPLALLLASLFYFYRDIAIKVLVFGALLSGLITWGIGRPSYHIGASGVIYLLASFIFFKGIFTKHYRLVALSLIVVFIYGSLLWYIFPVKNGISWEGHLGGFLTGFGLAFLVKGSVPSPKKFAWEHDDYNEEEDEFLKHFDEEGNFIETIHEEHSQEENTLQVKYFYKKNSEDVDSE
ncbi:rhomboid family intramembrane serine protease [Maribacter sp. 2308TA10-17]|uniref:rhomboid family intramembrane serine protease n=1 Tax=Maribacter sp. 2308TA10-17 TaxID=3386276 RepID=UPI0039BC3708